ncbi:uncharacterized protein OCT59_028390 [Rhizophagus irregularis]|uniref:uncharacterized protein n=1 Tax=Rhizophagus irregularis TaxID=588596 RepID=UPI00331AC23D|nr:hypothetical protein OCT59_028390 [Rhizophagus irregularis]
MILKFKGPEHQSKAPDLFSKVKLQNIDFFYLYNKMSTFHFFFLYVQNITRLNFEGKGSQKTNNELPLKIKKSQNKFWTSISKVKEAKTSSGLPYQSKGS